MPYSEEVRAEKQAKRKEQYKQVVDLMKKEGLTVPVACDKVGMEKTNFYRAKAEVKGTFKLKSRAAAKPEKKAYQRKAVTVTEMQVSPIRPAGSFMLFGTPTELAAFARAYG